MHLAVMFLSASLNYTLNKRCILYLNDYLFIFLALIEYSNIKKPNLLETPLLRFSSIQRKQVKSNHRFSAAPKSPYLQMQKPWCSEVLLVTKIYSAKSTTPESHTSAPEILATATTPRPSTPPPPPPSRVAGRWRVRRGMTAAEGGEGRRRRRRRRRRRHTGVGAEAGVGVG